MTQNAPEPIRNRRREPLFNAPWPSMALTALILGGYLLQSRLLSDDAAARMFAVSFAALRDGRWDTLVSSIGIHMGWLHAGMNALGAIAFGPPVARAMGTGARGAAVFAGFLLVCGVFSGLVFVVAHWGSAVGAVGASGAVSGLIGAALRLLNPHGGVAPLFRRDVLTMAGVFIVMNVVLGLTGTTPGAEEVQVAWEAHVAGLVLGLVLLGPALRLAGSRPTAPVRAPTGPWG